MDELGHGNGERTVRAVLRRHAQEQPDELAFIEGDQRLTWAQYDERSSDLAVQLRRLRLPDRARIAVLLPDGPTLHVAFVAIEKAGHVIVGIGPKAGTREITHLLRAAGATALVSSSGHRSDELTELVGGWRRELAGFRHHVVIDLDGGATFDGEPSTAASAVELAALTDGVGVEPDELFLLNSTSGTTGLPKCVMHSQRRWFRFHDLAVEAGELRPDDVFMSAVAGPFGFGIWTAHVTPLLLGATTVLLDRFSPAEAVHRIEQHGVTVLASVSTQFVMMLNEPSLQGHRLPSLRVLFTGGEAVPRDAAKAFEELTGSLVLQFYGSNETGALSRTTTTDSRQDRLTTAGCVIEEMSVRILDDDGRDITATGGPGQAACRGPVMCLGYYGEQATGSSLFTPDGWMLTGDLVTIDDRGYLSVIGRKADIIIRGGKNISATAVEEELLTHPLVEMAAAVAMPDPVYGERVAAYLVTADGAELTLPDLLWHLRDRGVTKEWWPEHLVVVDELPISSGGKVAKGQLREDIRARIGAEVSPATSRLDPRHGREATGSCPRCRTRG